MTAQIFYIIFILSLFPYLLFIIFFTKGLFYRKNEIVNAPASFSEPVSIIIACYNEAPYIEKRILALLSADNWIINSEIIVVSGGSTDGTSEILKKYNDHPYVQPYIFEERVSKISGVNFAVSKAQHSILIFSDCRQTIKSGSVKSLVRNLACNNVGTVSCTLVDSDGTKPASLQRKLLNNTAFYQSESASSLNLFGALYAQKRECYREVPEDIIFDDLFVTASTLCQKRRLIQDPDAAIYDMDFNQYYAKERIMRLARGLLLFLMNHYKLIHKIPLKSRIRFLIQKYLKLLFPFSLLMAVLACAGLIAASHHIVPLTLLSIVTILMVFPYSRKLIIHFILVHHYFALATILFIFGKQRSVSWEKLKNNNENSSTQL